MGTLAVIPVPYPVTGTNFLIIWNFDRIYLVKCCTFNTQMVKQLVLKIWLQHHFRASSGGKIRLSPH